MFKDSSVYIFLSYGPKYDTIAESEPMALLSCFRMTKMPYVCCRKTNSHGSTTRGVLVLAFVLIVAKTVVVLPGWQGT